MLTLLVNSKIWSLFLPCCHLFPALWDPIIPAAAVVLSLRSALPTQDSEFNTAHLFIPYCQINTFLLEIFTWVFYFNFFSVLFLYQHAHCSEFFHNFLYSCHGGSGISASLRWAIALAVAEGLEVKPWAMLCGATRGGWVTVESSEKRDPLEEGTASHPCVLPWEAQELY